TLTSGRRTGLGQRLGPGIVEDPRPGAPPSHEKQDIWWEMSCSMVIRKVLARRQSHQPGAPAMTHRWRSRLVEIGTLLTNAIRINVFAAGPGDNGPEGSRIDPANESHTVIVKQGIEPYLELTAAQLGQRPLGVKLHIVGFGSRHRVGGFHH